MSFLLLELRAWALLPCPRLILMYWEPAVRNPLPLSGLLQWPPNWSHCLYTVPLLIFVKSGSDNVTSLLKTLHISWDVDPYTKGLVLLLSTIHLPLQLSLYSINLLLKCHFLTHSSPDHPILSCNLSLCPCSALFFSIVFITTDLLYILPIC